MNNTENPDNKGKLYIVSTPIGNKDDITLRAINTIKRCDIIVCEEMKMGALTLKNLNLAKELIPLNENNESDMTMEVLNLLKAGKKIALISDAGTPVFADPGLYLVRTAISNNIEMEVVPGVSSIMTAIVRSGFDIYEFLYAGFLPRKNEDRDRKIQRLARERRTVVILETPYRLNTLLNACAEILPDRRVYLGMNLTMPFETHHYGTFAELVKKFENSKIKSEFVLIMEGNKEWIGPKKTEISDDYYDDDDDDDDDGPVEYEYPVKAHIKPPVSTNRKIISDKSRFKKSTDSRTGSYSGAKKPGSGFSRGSSSGSRDYNSSSPRKSYGGESGGSSEFRKSPDRDYKSSSPRKSYGGESGGSSEFRKSPDRDFKSSSPRKSYGGESGGSSEFRKSPDRDFKSSSPRKSYGGESGGSSEFRKSPDRDFKSSSPRKSYGGESGGSSEFRKSPDRDYKSSSPRKSYGGESGGSSEFRKSPDRDYKSSSPRKSYGGESEGGFSGVKRTPRKTISRGRPSKGGFSKK
ncbi:MAG: 16S rRNA (cytidine(1402)-2'-O)-methyltransferase [Candidatus Kapabacteria bacterium]|nr:16S rRNA (cytidine(1402)-2'-O)-methyltransferase [Candidatus Kapabacteria bacterium]